MDNLKFYSTPLGKAPNLLVAMLLLFSIAGYFGQYSSILDILSHFKFYYLLLSIIVFLLILPSGSKGWMITGIVVISLNLYELYPSFIRVHPSQPYSRTIKILQANVSSGNRHFDKLLELIEHENPDIISLQEIDIDRWKTMEFLDDYPYSIMASRKRRFGISLFSKIELVDLAWKEWGRDRLPVILGKLKSQNSTVGILATHLSPAESFKRRNQQLLTISRLMDKTSPMIIVGDLNISRWSPIYKKFIEKLHLKSSADGFGLLATWPSFFPILPIDHCLVSKNIEVINIKTAGRIGSDHVPLIVELGLE
jgi:endonuclease/exonuclease/phosphatase (EEP) superfamily protein YafD